MDWFIQLVNDHPTLGYLWLIWVTFHDIVQWIIMAALGMTVYGQRRKAREDAGRRLEIAEAVRKEVAHIHTELHTHIREDTVLHGRLGQSEGLTEGA